MEDDTHKDKFAMHSELKRVRAERDRLKKQLELANNALEIAISSHEGFVWEGAAKALKKIAQLEDGKDK